MNKPLIAVSVLLLAAGCASTSEQSTPATSSPASPTSSAAAVQVPTVTTTLAENLQAPWSVLPLDATSALISERDTAKVLLLRDGATTVAGEAPEALPGGEGGLLGLAMSAPDADKVYAYYTAATDNRVVVFDFDGQRLSGERTILGGIPKGMIHNGGRLAFGPDGYLYVATGETGQPDLAQDQQSLAGKILRIRTNGSPAPGNPDPDSPVWSYGHRNVQGLAWDGQGQMWATEFGEKDVDELNLIRPGRDYGWPQCEGACDVPGTTNPAATWSPTATASPSGLAILEDTAWVAALRGQALYEVELDGKNAADPQIWLEGDLGRIRDVVTGPDGDLWLVTNNTDGRGTPGAGDDRLLVVEVP